MRYPEMTEIPRQMMVTENWKGYNHRPRNGDGESYDERNMGSEEAPILAPRRQRGTFRKDIDVQGLIAKDNLCWVEGSKFVMDGYAHEMNLSTAAEDCPKRLVSMGAYVIILPDKKYINTADTTDRGNIEAWVTVTAECRIALEDGTALQTGIASDAAPDSPANGQYWLDTSGTAVLKRWSEADSAWVSMPTSYVKITAPGIGAAFREGDGVSITAQEPPAGMEALLGSTVIWSIGEDYLLVPGALEDVYTAEITVERRMPLMDYIIESGNRLWGCRYGPARNGEIVNEIYASKLGDFKNWNVFQGLSTDSWVGACGTDGQWTGAINYLGYPLFFKADHIHRVYGQLPEQYSIQDVAARGVEKGSGDSLAMVNEVLLYKSRVGIMAYDGSLPTLISDALGEVCYHSAVAGSHGNRYWISMLDEKDTPVLLCFDMKAGVWHKEDGLRASCFCSARNHMYCMAGRDIVSLTGDGEPEGIFQWEIITGELGLKQNSGFAQVNMPEEKYIAKLGLRLSIEPGSWVDIDVEYDGSGNWIPTAHLEGMGLRSFTVPIRPRRCDWLRLKISGMGMARIYSLAKYLEGGSDVNSPEGMMLDF